MSMMAWCLVAFSTIHAAPGMSSCRQDFFQAETVDSAVAIGYGVALGDVDGDGKPDILLADQKQFVWYQNPGWTRHVMVENLTGHDNVCIAARDIDGDGKVEVAVGAEWNPDDTENSGSVHYLLPQDDRTLPWKPIELTHEPVIHRMRWVRTAADQFMLVVAPLHGRGNKNGNGHGVRLLAYKRPANPEFDPWKATLLDDQFHITHNFDVGQWDATDPNSEPEEVAWLGKEGAILIAHEGGELKKRLLPVIEGGGEIRMGRLEDNGRFLATVEPFHGDKLVVYEYPAPTDESRPARKVVNPNLSQGHALATGDFLNRGYDQIVVGWRNPNAAGQVGIMIYWKGELAGEHADPIGKPAEWTGAWVDENKIACEDLQVADLDGDGNPDIVASGRSTHNLKIYWNRDK